MGFVKKFETIQIHQYQHKTDRGLFGQAALPQAIDQGRAVGQARQFIGQCLMDQRLVGLVVVRIIGNQYLYRSVTIPLGLKIMESKPQLGAICTATLGLVFGVAGVTTLYLIDDGAYLGAFCLGNGFGHCRNCELCQAVHTINCQTRGVGIHNASIPHTDHDALQRPFCQALKPVAQFAGIHGTAL